MNCPVCEHPATEISSRGRDVTIIDCVHCETFEISGTALRLFGLKDKMNRRASLDLARARALPDAMAIIFRDN